MTLVHSLVLFAASSSSSKKATSSSSSITFILFLLVIGVAGYFLLLRPQQQKARKQKELQSDIGVGDEVLTVGGIVGTVLDINSERVTIITGEDSTGMDGDHAVPTRMVLVRNAIARKIEPTTPTYDEAESEDEHEADEEHEEHEEYPRYEYHPEEEEAAAEQDGSPAADEPVNRNGRRRRKSGSNGSDKADTGTGEDAGP